MKDIDFLPKSFHERIRQQRQRHRNMIYTVVLMVMLGGLHFLNSDRLQSVEASLKGLQKRHEDMLAYQAQINSLKIHKENLSSKLRLINRLEDNAPLDAVIGEITRLMGDTMSLQLLTIKTLPYKTPAGEKTDGHINPLLDRGDTEVELIGVAADDIEVGMFYGKLSACPVFEKVSMSYSRQTEMAGRLMRSFALKFKVKPIMLDN